MYETQGIPNAVAAATRIEGLTSDFDRKRAAMLAHFELMLRNGEVRSLSAAIEIVGSLQSAMCQLATLLCDPAS